MAGNAIQDEVYVKVKAFVSGNKGCYGCGGYIYSSEEQNIGQFCTKLAVGNTTLKKTSSNASISDGSGLYSISSATYGVYSDKNCMKQKTIITTDNGGNTDAMEMKAGIIYIKEFAAPVGHKLNSAATLNILDTPRVTDILIKLFKIYMETQKDTPQSDASLEGEEFTWEFNVGYYTTNNLPSRSTKTWVTKIIAEKNSDGTIHYISRLSDEYKLSENSFYT